MKLLEEYIKREGTVKPGNILKVDSFINQQLDVRLFVQLAREFARIFKGVNPTKILTIEASGIGIACVTALEFDVPVIYAKKNRSANRSEDVFSAEVTSYTHGRKYEITISKEFISPDDRILLIDDFLATGSALRGLIELVNNSGAELLGAGIVIEKAFQTGGSELRGRGIRVESLARISAMSVENGVEFCD